LKQLLDGITRLSLIEVWSGMNSAMLSGASFPQIERM